MRCGVPAVALSRVGGRVVEFDPGGQDLAAGSVARLEALPDPSSQRRIYPLACLVAGMVAGADSINDMGLLWHGAMSALFSGIRAPSTLGSYLRSYTWRNVA
jgi:hypothetical protein